MPLLPPGISAKTFADAIKQFQAAVGKEWVFTTDEDVALYRDAYSPFWGEKEEILVSAAVAPNTVEEVSKVVRTANSYKIPIYPVGTGKNLGYGGCAPNLSGSVVLDLKRMNRIIEVDDKRHFAIVEPGVAYFDLYRYIQERGLKVWIDVPDPGWGSVVGNALDHGVGYTFGGFRDHFYSHCGMEVVLPNGEIMRTGMGALPNAKTWAEYHYGAGPYVDGLFSQSNFGVVTKMGFHLMPAPEAYMNATVIVPRRSDIVPLIEGGNHLEHSGVIGMPNYGSPLGGFGAAADPQLAALLAKPGGASVAELEDYAAKANRGFFSLQLQFYGGTKVIQAQWDYAKEVFGGIRGVRFQDGQFIKFPATPEQLDRARKVAIGIPNLSQFMIGARSATNPSPTDGHLWFSPIIPKTGEAVLEAQEAFMKAFRDMGVPSMVSPFSMPATWMFRAFIFIMGFPVYRNNVEQNKKTRDVFRHLIQVAADHGWGEYRTAPAFQQQVTDAYSYNNHALRRLQETLKDAIDPNGIISAGRYGIWPRQMRRQRKA
jgi:4-cresol dehydrogenase (hydroxylating)